MGLGAIGYGASVGLEQVLERRLRELMRQDQEKRAQEQLQIQREQQASLAQDRVAGQEAQRRMIDLSEVKRRDDINRQGLELMQADKGQMDMEAALKGLSPRLRQIADLRKVGVTGISPQDLQTPEEQQAIAAAKDGAEFEKWERRNNITNAQANERQNRSDQLMRSRADEAREEKPPTSAQSTLSSYASRLEQAEPTVTALEQHITKMNPVSFEAQLWADRPSLQSKEVQQYAQASRNLINAVLRRESGAVINPSEFAEARAQYLPQPGDTPDVLEMKRKNRRLNAETFKKGAGKAYQSVDEALGDKAPTQELTYDPKTKTFKKSGG